MERAISVDSDHRIYSKLHLKTTFHRSWHSFLSHLPRNCDDRLVCWSFFQSLLIAQERTLDHMKYGRYWFVLAMFLLLTNTQVMISISNEVMQG